MACMEEEWEVRENPAPLCVVNGGERKPHPTLCDGVTKLQPWCPIRITVRVRLGLGLGLGLGLELELGL